MKKMTKKARLEKAREIIDRNDIDVPFSEYDVRCFSIVCDKEIQAAVRKINPQFPNNDPRHLHTLIDGVWEARSWRKWINPLSPVQEAKRVMRFCVSEDMREFMESCDEKKCNSCGSNQDLTVDHVYPPFDDIANAFIDAKGVPEIVGPSDVSRVINEFADINNEASWISFHASHAIYQILCRSCNASKGKR